MVGRDRRARRNDPDGLPQLRDPYHYEYDHYY